jgi:hypothetical protein
MNAKYLSNVSELMVLNMRERGERAKRWRGTHWVLNKWKWVGGEIPCPHALGHLYMQWLFTSGPLVGLISHHTTLTTSWVYSRGRFDPHTSWAPLIVGPQRLWPGQHDLIDAHSKRGANRTRTLVRIALRNLCLCASLKISSQNPMVKKGIEKRAHTTLAYTSSNSGSYWLQVPRCRYPRYLHIRALASLAAMTWIVSFTLNRYDMDC